MERNRKTILLPRTERNGMEWNENRTIKNEQERNDLAKGPRSRTERNNLKKIGMCPALQSQPLYIIDNLTVINN